MPTLLVICSGNTCRSPVVEALLIERLKINKFGNWHVHSAGTRAKHGQPASKYSVELCQELFGLDLSAHRSKKLDGSMLSSADLVLCMTAEHQKDLLDLSTHNHDKIKLLAEMISEDGFDVPDPFGQDKDAYRTMVTTVSDLIYEGLPKIVELAQA